MPNTEDTSDKDSRVCKSRKHLMGGTVGVEFNVRLDIVFSLFLRDSYHIFQRPKSTTNLAKPRRLHVRDDTYI